MKERGRLIRARKKERERDEQRYRYKDTEKSNRRTKKEIKA
jgi:hypothetical protein